MLPNSFNDECRCIYNAKSHAKVLIIFYIRKCAREKIIENASNRLK